MDLHRCLKILEIDRTASMGDVNQAYRDIVNVWHPDRFTYNPRLRRKAEEKIKEINIAYETLRSFFARNQPLGRGQKGFPFTADKGVFNGAQTTDETRDRTEAAFEMGTQLILSVWSSLSSRLRRSVDTQVSTIKEEGHGKGKG